MLEPKSPMCCERHCLHQKVAEQWPKASPLVTGIQWRHVPISTHHKRSWHVQEG